MRRRRRGHREHQLDAKATRWDRRSALLVAQRSQAASLGGAVTAALAAAAAAAGGAGGARLFEGIESIRNRSRALLLLLLLLRVTLNFFSSPPEMQAHSHI